MQKSGSKMSQEATLMKMFKYFDVMDRGAVDYSTFAKVCEKTGMYFPE